MDRLIPIYHQQTRCEYRWTGWFLYTTNKQCVSTDGQVDSCIPPTNYVWVGFKYTYISTYHQWSVTFMFHLVLPEASDSNNDVKFVSIFRLGHKKSTCSITMTSDCLCRLSGNFKIYNAVFLFLSYPMIFRMSS